MSGEELRAAVRRFESMLNTAKHGENVTFTDLHTFWWENIGEQVWELLAKPTVRAALAAPSTPEPSGPDEADLIRLSVRDLVRELAETVHQTGGIRDHVDTTQNKGWTVAGIETCGDPLCVDALQFLRAAPSTPEPSGDVERLRQQNHDAAVRHDREVAELRSKVARYESAFQRARELVRGSPVDWTDDPPSGEPDGWWRYTSQQNRQVIAAAVLDAAPSTPEPSVPDSDPSPTDDEWTLVPARVLAAPSTPEPSDLATIVSDSLAATTEGTDYTEAPDFSDEPGSPYVMRLTNEIASRLRAVPSTEPALDVFDDLMRLSARLTAGAVDGSLPVDALSVEGILRSLAKALDADRYRAARLTESQP